MTVAMLAQAPLGCMCLGCALGGVPLLAANLARGADWFCEAELMTASGGATGSGRDRLQAAMPLHCSWADCWSLNGCSHCEQIVRNRRYAGCRPTGPHVWRSPSPLWRGVQHRNRLPAHQRVQVASSCWRVAKLTLISDAYAAGRMHDVSSLLNPM